MKIFSLIFLVVLLTGEAKAEKVSETIINALNDVSNKTVDEMFKKFLEDLKVVVKNGSKFWEIPPLDPYKTGPVNVSVKSKDIRADMSALSIGISGLSNYKVIKAEIKGLLIIGVGFQWPELKGNISSYNIFNGRVMDFVTIFGKGDAVYNLKDLKFTTEIFFQFENKTASIKKMKSEVSLGGLEVYTDGLYNDVIISQKISAVISAIGPEAIQTDQYQLTEAINNQVIDLVNKFLKKFAFDDLINSMTWKFPWINQTIQEEYDASREKLFSIIS